MYKTITLFGKTKGGWGREGKEGREGRGEGKESTNFFISFIWFVREKWRETHVIGGSHHKYSLLSLIFLPIWEKRIWWAIEEFFPLFSFLSHQSLLTKQSNLFLFLPFLFFSSQIPLN